MQADAATLWDEFWPPRSQHLVSAMRLAPLAQAGVRLAAMREPIRQLGAFANAIRDLQSVAEIEADGMEQNSLRHAAANAIERLASLTLDAKNRAAIATRAELVTGAPPTLERAMRMYDGLDAELVLFCGNLKTWHAKAGRGLYSAFVALPDVMLQRAAADLDTSAFLEACRAELEDDALSLSPAPAFVIADLLMCAGEANRHPKHFAYFFPEDDWDLHALSGDCPPLRTVVFPNVYAHRWMTGSGERLRRFAPDVWSDGLAMESTLRPLLVRWMLGHDLGHAMRHPGTSVPGLRAALGERDAMTVEEALADGYGYFLLTSRDRPGSASDAEAMGCFLGEMLRYAARGRDVFQDADAALIELSFLNDLGAVTIEGQRLTTDPVRLRLGMVEFTRQMTRLVLDGNADGLRRVLANYLHPGGAGAQTVSAFTEALIGSSELIPASATYVFQS